jgi:hypothetical protein
MKKIYSLVLGLLLISSSCIQAQWTQTNGPFANTTVNCFATDGSTLFAGTQSSGIYRSTDFGSSWQLASTGFGIYPFHSMLLSGSNLFAAGDNGLYYSNNNGASWSGIFNGAFYSSAGIVQNGSTLIACNNGGIYRSTTNGGSWTSVGTQTNATLAVCGNVFLAANTSGVYKSVDDGITWSQVNSAQTGILTMITSGTNIFAGTGSGGVLLSTDNGTTWTAKNTGLTSLLVSSFSFNGTDLYAGTAAGVYKTSNSGTSWVAANTGITTTTVNALTIMGASLFIGTPNTGIYLSTNFGASWALSNNGLITSDVRALGFNGSNLFAGSNGSGAYLTSSSGANWNGVNSGLMNQTVNAFASSGVNTFAGTGGGVFLTTNNGASWTAVNTGLTNTNVVSLVMIGANLFAGTSGGVFLSANNGASWSAVNTGLSRLVVNTLTTNGTNLFAGTDNSGVFMSSNNGASWSAVNTGLPLNWVYSMTSSGGYIYAALASSGVYVSSNNGTSWTQSNSGMVGSIYAIASAGSNIFAFGGAMNVSTNNGASWTDISSGLPNINRYGFAASGNTVLVGTTGLGVWKRQLDEILCSVNPPVMSSAASATICSGGAINIPLTNTGVAANYTWIAASNSQASGQSTTAQTSGTLSNVITNSSNLSPTTVTYTVTPKGIFGGCTGTPQLVNVTVNPSPTMTSNTTLTVCSGQAVGLTLTSSVASSYSWIAANNPNTTGESTTLHTSGTINDVIINNTLVPQTVTYTITPSSSAGSCAGPSQTLTVTVNPTPVMTSASNATICSGSTVNMNLTSNVQSGYTWIATDNLNTTGESTSYQSTATLNNTVVNNTVAVQVVTYTITPTAVVGGCTGTQIFSLTVNPAPKMTSANAATICSGNGVSIALSSDIASTYVWNATGNPNTSGESISAQSTGTLANTIVNNSTSAQVVYYQVTPTSSSGSCAGATQSVVVTVNPVPVMSSASSASICSGGTANIALGANIASSFTWIATDNLNTTGESLSTQSGNVLNNTISSSSTLSQNVVYTIVPTANLGGCQGAAQTVTVTVNPIPTMTSASAGTICSGSSVSIPLTSDATATYIWSAMANVNTSGESTTSQSGNVLSNTIYNTSGVVQHVVYTVTPSSSSGNCAGAAQTVTVTVNPEPLMISSANATICSGGTVNLPLVSNVNATFTWIATNNPNTTGQSTSAQTSATLQNTLVNTTTVPQDVIYTVTPTSVTGACVGSSQSVSVLVNPLDNAGFSYSSATYCQSGNDPSALITGVSGGSFSATPGLVFQNQNNGLVNLAASALGTYTITYSTNGTCSNSATFSLTITTAPAASFSYAGTPYCSSAANPLPVFAGGSSGGVFSANPSGLSFVSTATGAVNLSASIPGTYTVVNAIAASGGCASANATSLITINPLPVVSYAGLASTYYYNDPAVTLTGSPAGGTFTGTAVTAGTFNPSAAGGGIHAVTYSYTDGNGCLNTAVHSTTVLTQPAPPSICEVTVDNAGVNNEVYWDNSLYSKVDSFIVYRETGNGYQRVGAQAGNVLSLFTDTVRKKYFPNTGDPNAGTYRYKLQIRDSSGNYSPMSPFHNTIFNNKTSGTFTWNAYQIEGQPVPLPSSVLITYDLWRDDASNGRWHLVNSVTGSQLTQTDVGWSSVLDSTASWRVLTNWTIGCTPTARMESSISTSRSNIRHGGRGIINTGITPLELNQSVSLFPNPARENVTIELSGAALQGAKVTLYNVLGELVYQNQLNSPLSVLDVSSFARGVYTVVILNRGAYVFRKLVIN